MGHRRQEELRLEAEGIQKGLEELARKGGIPEIYILRALGEIALLRKKDEWIPCSRELPKPWDIDLSQEPEDIIWPEYIVTIEGCSKATVLHYDFQEDTWFDDDGNPYNVVAWRPMPDAYRPERKAVGEDYKQHIIGRFLKVE